MEIKLAAFEKELISDIVDRNIEFVKSDDSYPTVAYAVWIDTDSNIEFGRVRWGYKNNIHSADGTTEDSISASPFPGAWSVVPVSKVIRIRHAEAF
jgi:hypothetical protein